MSTQAYGNEDIGGGWLAFTAVLLFAMGFFRIISGISYLSKSNKIENFTGGLFSNHTWGWGVWDLIIAAVAILAGLSLLGGGGFGRVFGYIFGILVVVQGFTVMNLAPWYGAISIIVGVMVVYGLAATPKQAPR
jgi:hypothetical protein